MPNNRNANSIVNPYGAGDVRLDSSPYARYFIMQENQKRAKDEALDKYFLDMQKNVTPAGMRTIDIPILLEGQKKVMEHWVKNKKFIKNPALDNGKALTEYSGMIKDQMGTVQASKNEFTGSNKLVGIMADPNKSSLVEDEVFPLMDANNKPLNTPGFVSTNDILNNPLFHAKPYTPAEQRAMFQSYSDVAGKPKPKLAPEKTIRDPNDKYRNINTYVTQHDDKGLANIAVQAGQRWDNDPRTRVTFKNEYYDNLDEAEKVAKRVLGPQFEIKTPRDKYIAETILGHSIPTIEIKPEKNEEAIRMDNEAFRLRMEGVKAANRKKAQDHAKALKAGTESEWLEKQVKDAEDFAAESPSNKVSINGPSGKQKGLIIGFPAPVLKTLSVNSGGQNIQPDAVLKYEDGSYAPVFYKRDKDFNVVKGEDGGSVIDLTIPSPKISREQMKSAYGKSFATGLNLTGQFEGGEEVEPSGTIEERKQPAKKKKPY